MPLDTSIRTQLHCGLASGLKVRQRCLFNWPPAQAARRLPGPAHSPDMQ